MCRVNVGTTISFTKFMFSMNIYIETNLKTQEIEESCVPPRITKLCSDVRIAEICHIHFWWEKALEMRMDFSLATQRGKYISCLLEQVKLH